jgi:hypothetical protein
VRANRDTKEIPEMNSQTFSRFAVSIAAVVLGFSTFALAGPPMICHPIAIGQAQTLPPVDLNYRKASGSYDLNNLTKDTLAILDSDTSVLVHMETLRRATIYARQDSVVAKQLLTRLHARAESSDGKGFGALAWFDFGYIAETYKQWMGKGEPNPANGVDGYAWVEKAIRQRGSDAEMEFAAALITLLGGPEREHNEHVQKAIAGAKTDSLLAQNISSAFGNQTTAASLANSSK